MLGDWVLLEILVHVINSICFTLSREAMISRRILFHNSLKSYNFVMLFTLLILVLLLAPFLYRNWLWQNWEIGAPYEATSPKTVDRVIKLCNLKRSDVFCDLGSGDGRIVMAAALTGARAIGIEKDKIRAWYSNFWLRLLNIKNAKIINKDIFSVDLSLTSVVCVFLTLEGNKKLENKLKRELKKGSRVISLGFPFKNWEHKRIDHRGNNYGPLYLYAL